MGARQSSGMGSAKLFAVILLTAGLVGSGHAETIRLEVADWADVVRDDVAGAPARSLPNTGELLHVGFWGPIGSDDHYVYLKFDIPTHLADKEILSATFQAYNLRWMSQYHCDTIFSYIENDNWAREAPDPFPMYREPRVFSQSQFAEEGQWYRLDVAPYLFMPGEGPGSALTLQMEQSGPGHRGLRIPGPTHEDPALRPYLEITYADVPVAGPRILIADDSDAFVWNAARVLKEYIAQATDQVLPIVSVDRTDELPAAAMIVDGGWLAQQAGVDPTDLAYDGFIVRNVDGRLVLTGAPERGVLYAVMDYLERDLGCRWYSPERMVIPTGRVLNFNVPSRREEPAFEMRSPYLGGSAVWMAASRFTNTTGIWGQDPLANNHNPHSFYQIAPPEIYFADHPDWYSYQNGVWFTNGGQLNFHKPDLTKLVSESVVQQMADHPEWLNMYVSQRDCLGWSQDPVTNAFDAREGSTTASLVHFVNQVAGAVAEAHPDRHVLTLAYHQSLTPPKTLRCAPNVRLMICTPWSLMPGITSGGPIGQYYLQMLRDWAGKCDYPMAWMYHISEFHGLTSDSAVLQQDYQALRDAGIKGFFCEFGTARDGPHYDLRLYMLAKLWWNPDVDMDELLRDFHEGYYGKGAAPKMLDYYYAVTSPPNNDLGNEQWLDGLERILNEARDLAEDDFARRKIDVAMRAVLANKLFRFTSEWDVRDGHMQNHPDTPEAKVLFERIDELAQAVGDGKSYEPQQLTFDQEVVVLDNGDLEVVVVPGTGGSIARIRDLKTGREISRAGLRDGAAFDGVHITYPLPYVTPSLEVQAADARKVEMTATSNGRRVKKTVRLAPSGPSFKVSSRLAQSEPEPLSDAFLSRLEFSVGGKVADCYLVYRDGEGQMHSKPVRNPWECMSSGWGPTGLLAVVNPKTNTGLLWELANVHNGGWYRVDPYNDIFSFDFYGERAKTGAGEMARQNETITILRDARAWCERQGLSLGADSGR